MLQGFSTDVQALLDKATEARARALQALNPDDRQFWLDMEQKWLALARSSQEVQRTSDTLAHHLSRKEAG